MRWGFSMSYANLDVDENLPDFFNALRLSDKDWFMTDNEYSKKEYKY